MNTVCVFAGSSSGEAPAYAGAARALAEAMVARNLDLVYGGGRVGLMGVLADRVLALGGRVCGIIPRALYDREVGHDGCQELLIVDTMHQRKAAMETRADAFIALPGGIGTLEEIFEIFTWTQLGIHRKPLGFLNVAGYYDQLIGFLDHVTEQGFLRQIVRDVVLLSDNAGDLLDRFARYRAPDLERWINPEQT